MALNFEWDARKARANLRKHGVSFDEAGTVFGDPLSIAISDPAHSKEEERWILLGRSGHQRILVVVHVVRGKNIRVISARRATTKEKGQYAKKA